MLERLARVHPDNPSAHAQLGVLLASHSQLEAAKAALERALELDSERVAVRRRLNAVLERRRKRGDR